MDSFFVAVPASCVCAIANEFAHSEYLRKLIIKFLVLAISLVSVIPFGVFLTEQINDTYSDTIQQTFESAMLIAEEGPEVETEGGNAFTDFFVDIKDGVTEFFSDTTGVLDMAKSIINAMVDAIAVLVITNCIVPLFAALLMIWALMWVTNISTPAEKIGKIMRNSINTVKAVRSRVSTDMDDE